MYETACKFVGTVIVWLVGSGFCLFAACWLFYMLSYAGVQMVNVSLRWRNYYKVFGQMKLTKEAFVHWAAGVCRKNKPVGNGWGTAIDLDKLRTFMAEYDPDNDLKWKPEPSGGPALPPV